LPPLEIGWREWVAFPDLKVTRIKAKIDTGAKTSAIHAFRIKEVMKGGAPHVQFFLHPEQKRKKPEIKCVAPVIDIRRIRSSNGETQERYIIESLMKLGGREWPVELSLSKRDDMGFRLLIGRDAITKKVIIHPGKSYLLGRNEDGKNR